MITAQKEIRLGLPSKGPLYEPTLNLLASAGLAVHKPNPRQYRAEIPALPGLVILFQRPGDIVVSVREGSLDFGITGWDVFSERRGDNGRVLPIHPALGYGFCTLNVIVPEVLEQVNTMADLRAWQQALNRPLRVATKFPNLTRAYLLEHEIAQFELIFAEGTLEIAPAVGFADVVSDLVSTGTTLHDNRLKKLKDGQVLASQACLIANRESLKSCPQALALARQLLEFIVAHLRASECVSVFANMRGETPDVIAERMFTQPLLGGLQGPTISPVVSRDGSKWYAVHLIVRKAQLVQAIAGLRQVGGSGVVVTPVTYIFEEEPHEYCQMLKMLKD
ncbi:MAG: ATP phosphoribosyltransferase [Anaerolineae bacterium]|nr:ATP phosphoribosyltransferase [Anaerolineae bacterium]